MARKNSNGFGSIRKKKVKGKTYFEARYTDPITHEQRSIGATTETECRQKLLDVLAKINIGTYTTPKTLTLSDWIDEWLEIKKKREPGTYDSYESISRLYIKPKLGKAKLQDIRRGHCQDFIDSIDKSPKYIHNIAGALSNALGEAVKREIIHKNPAYILDLPTIEKKEPIALDSTAQEAFTAAVNVSEYRNVYLIALHTGARISEVLGLKWSHVNMKTGEIKVRGQLERKRRKGDTREYKDKTKSKEKREVFVPEYVLTYLADEKKRQAENKLRSGSKWNNEDGLIFTRPDGSPVPHRTVENHFRKIKESIGHPEITLHTLRKTFVTNEEQAGTDIKTIGSMVGHKSTELTLEVYTAATKEMKRKAAQRKQAAFEKQSTT
jgi:integrase